MSESAAVAVLALALHTWALSRNNMANSYCAAAVKSMTLSWKAFHFGSLDPGELHYALISDTDPTVASPRGHLTRASAEVYDISRYI